MAVCGLCGRRVLDGLRATLRPAVWNSRFPPPSPTDRLPARTFSSSSLFLTKISPQEETSTHFGFETVLDTEKTGKVHQVFEQVADTYDLMNDLMSAGIHRLWKDQFVRTLALFPGTKILDVAGGTGDIAFRLVRSMDETSRRTKKAKAGSPTDKLEEGGDHDVTVLDLSESMLEVGKKRALSLNIESRIKWVHGNAEELPFPDATFDAYTIAFGIRNVTHIEVALDEAYRVLKPGGRFMCLEFSQVPNPLLAWLYEKYSFQVIPVMGQLIASDWKSYQYLVESIRMFPDQEDFRLMLEEAGFQMATFTNLSQGICAIHSGFKF
ncbi:hypothetical protein RvY_14180 [Ramazzottius varieornatus]|uniref:2-methoxy-6-polyprenyl-1,4-benzoquinol methylase, mitochondrial n=1 Tax=Ramazzottius varieornatus TaxID=947166 RepID=A0A1D1VS43_RAMVA|nr:hypothetical protein RvY_14180 [Ramazzottius varieornatus]